MNKFAMGAVAGIALAAGVQMMMPVVTQAQPAKPPAPPAGAMPAMAMAAPGDVNARQCSRDQEEANKKLVESINPPTPDVLYSHMHPDYIQHNPSSLRFMEINHVTGRAGMALLRTAFDKTGFHYGAPKPPAGGKGPAMPMPNMTYKVVAECDLVIQIGELPQPDPQHPGQFYKAYNFDMYRIKDGKLYEHWDDSRINTPIPAWLTAPVKDLKPGSAANDKE